MSTGILCQRFVVGLEVSLFLKCSREIYVFLASRPFERCKL